MKPRLQKDFKIQISFRETLFNPGVFMMCVLSNESMERIGYVYQHYFPSKIEMEDKDISEKINKGIKTLILRYIKGQTDDKSREKDVFESEKYTREWIENEEACKID